MAANVETMFYVRETPWHGLGKRVEHALTSEEALDESGLNWIVAQKPVYTSDGILIPNYKANVRSSDNQILGVVTDRYRIVQNQDAFAFTDALIGEGVRYETAGSLQEGRKVWLLAKLPDKYIVNGDQIEPYIVFSNSHDGSSAIRVAMTPVRVVCQNTLNLALGSTKRCWSTKHTGNVQNQLHEARDTLELAYTYMSELSKEFDTLRKIKLPDKKVSEFINELIQLPEDATETQIKNIERLRSDITSRYFYAPDLKNLDKTGYRFINAVSDFTTHMKPLRKTATYQENLFLKTIEGNALTDKAYTMLKESA